jgi:hypothetical protein
MPIPVRERSDDGARGTVAYICIRVEVDGRGLRAALFVVNERVEPLDFCFNRIDVPSTVLWRAGEARRHAVRTLLLSLFPACPGRPDLLLAAADELPPQVFTEDLEVDIPLCLLTTEPSVAHAPCEPVEQLGERTHALWVGDPPASGAVARRLFEHLASRRLLIEPFERAARGLDEAYESA